MALAPHHEPVIDTYLDLGPPMGFIEAQTVNRITTVHKQER